VRARTKHAPAASRRRVAASRRNGPGSRARLASAAAVSRYFLAFFALAVLSVIGAWLGVEATGGFGRWQQAQFLGLFGVVEAAVGLSNIVTPNIWALPVAASRSPASRDAPLAWAALLRPHWGGAARAAFGAAFVSYAAGSTGVSFASAWLAPFVMLFALFVVAASAVAARWGVEHPDTDVVQFVLRRGGREHEIEPISLAASLLQLLLSVLTIPAVRLLQPSALYRPEIGPAPLALGAMGLATAGMASAAAFAWRGRLDWRAPGDPRRAAAAFRTMLVRR
jgi:hypothetical protein